MIAVKHSKYGYTTAWDEGKKDYVWHAITEQEFKEKVTWNFIGSQLEAWITADFAAAVEAGERMGMPREGMTLTEVEAKYFPNRVKHGEVGDTGILVILPRPGV